MHVRISKAATLMGVVKSTLRRGEKEKKLVADYRTLGGHRRYSMNNYYESGLEIQGNIVSLEFY